MPRTIQERIAINRAFGIALLFNQERYKELLTILQKTHIPLYSYPFKSGSL
jgi:hypothetical protein